MLRRCLNWDYRQKAIYQITLTLADRASQALGRIVVRRRGEGDDKWRELAAAKAERIEPDEIEAKVVLTALGEEILALWKRFSEFTSEIKPLYCEIMPDHLHAILEVTRPMAKPLGNAIGGFKTGCEKIYRKLSLSAQDKEDAAGARLWSEGFQDTILFKAGQLDNMFNYLRDNARRRAIKALYPDLFKVVSELKVDFSAAACSVPKAKAFGYFAALGNRFLLNLPLHQIQVSRSFFGYRRVKKPGGGEKIERDADGRPLIAFSNPEFDERRRAAALAAKRGDVLLSPCVSDGEREIARLALDAGCKLVVLKNKGFSPLEKPAGRYFDACADGRLLMLTPAAWPYQPGEKKMTRLDATAMNRLAQLLAGENAAVINYHGMKPANIDELAFLAVEKSEALAFGTGQVKQGGKNEYDK